MDTQYIYAGTRAKALERKLLNENQLELLLGAKSVDETLKVLQDTFLAPYISKHSGLDVTEALDQAVMDARATLESIAPHPEVLDILWIKYDYHNLKAIIKGKRAGLSNEEILKMCFSVGKHSPEKLMKRFEENKLATLNSHLHQARTDAEHTKEVFEVDLAMNTYYFKTIRTIAETYAESFVIEFVTLLIDLFNIKAALRAHAIDIVENKKVFVPGGTIYKRSLESKQSTLEALRRFGGEKRWNEPIAAFEKSGEYGKLEKLADEYVSEFLKDQSRPIFSPASLFSYFNAQKNNAQTIGAVVRAKKAGLTEKKLRTILRRTYA